MNKLRSSMLTIEDCIGLCRLTEDEIAEHRPVPDIIALEMGNYLCITPDGRRSLSRMIVADIEMARAHGNIAHAAKLRHVLQHFLEHHAGITFTEEQKTRGPPAQSPSKRHRPAAPERPDDEEDQFGHDHGQ